MHIVYFLWLFLSIFMLHFFSVVVGCYSCAVVVPLFSVALFLFSVLVAVYFLCFSLQTIEDNVRTKCEGVSRSLLMF